MSILRKPWPGIVVHIAALLPLALIGWDLARDQLTANPIEEVQLRTGKTALVLLTLSLACRPAAGLSGVEHLLGLRRLLGLYAFLYANLHLLNFLAIDYGFNFHLIQRDALVEKRFVAAGILAFVCLLPLAVTSTEGWRRRLGKRWTRLHLLAYPAALLAVVHFIWQTKVDFREPLVFGGIVVFLLALRLPVLNRFLCRRQLFR